MTASLAPSPKFQAIDANGQPLVGGKLYSYAAGTTTPLATYTDEGALTANTNPVILDSRGEASVWLANGMSYKLVLKTSADVEIWTVDDIGVAQNTISITNVTGVNDALNQFANPWGFSSDVDINDATLRISSTAIDPIISLSTSYTAAGNLSPDFPGAAGGSAPVGLYVQHEQIGTPVLNNAYTHSIMGYALNSASGDNDVIGVSGRARKLNISGGIGDAAGVWGSAYQESQQNGGVMGGEVHIYQNVAGQSAQDQLNAKWSVGLHVFSASTGSPAHAGVNIDGLGENAGFFGYWNGLVIERNSFHGNGVVGTVGINCGSWNALYNPQYGIKFGEAGRHIYSTGDLRISTAEGSKVQVVHEQNTGGATFQVLSTAGFNSAIDLVNDNIVQGQLFYDNVTDDVVVGTVGAVNLDFRTNEIYRGSFNGSGDFLVNQTAFNTGVGFGFTNTGYSTWYRSSATSTDGVLDVYSDWGATKRNVLRIQSDGNVLNYNNSYGSLSDISLKENITPSTPKLDALMQVNIRNFNMKGDDVKQIGVIAQELEEVFPALVSTDSQGIKSVKYSVFVPILIKAVQELNAKIGG